MWVKTDALFFLVGGAVTVDVVFVVLSVCCLVLLSASLFTVQFLNRWRPASWWSWEEAEEGSCWAVEVEHAANRQNSNPEIDVLSHKDNVALHFSSGFKRCYQSKTDWQVLSYGD